MEALLHDMVQSEKDNDFTQLRVKKRVVQKSVSEIEAIMGFNKVCPISLSVSDADEFSQNPDDYKSWYEEELRKLYE